MYALTRGETISEEHIVDFILAMKRAGRFPRKFFLAAATIMLCSGRPHGACAFITKSPTHASVPKALASHILDVRRGLRDSRSARSSLFSTAAPERVQVIVPTNGKAAVEDVPSNMSDAVGEFFFGEYRGPRYIVGILAYMFTWRLSLAGVTSTDALMFAGMTVFWWFQEHFLHGRLLHSERDWFGKDIHRGHHEKPYFHISIDPAWLMMGWLGAAHGLMRLALPLPLALSATLGYATAGLCYEWAHYIVHTRVFREHIKHLRTPG